MPSFVSFYPGPSQLDPHVAPALTEAAESGILSVNHRSAAFVALLKETVSLLKAKLEIPEQYTVFFTSSATECWEIIGESFASLVSFHLYNGAFGEKWFEYRQKLFANALGFRFPYHRQVGLNKMELAQQAGILCLTQNETSNGTQIKNRMLRRVRTQHPKQLIAIDATSSMGGAALDWLSADIWFASVQKCFGLPAGLAIMACSPEAIRKAKELGHRQHYNSLSFMAEKMEAFQTTHTPNVMNIFLLNRVLRQRANIKELNRHLIDRAQGIYFRLQQAGFEHLIHHRRLRSATVVTIKAKPEEVGEIKSAAKEKGFLLGNGYGNWKENTFRLANFPAITDEQMEELLEFLIGWKRAKKMDKEE